MTAILHDILHDLQYNGSTACNDDIASWKKICFACNTPSFQLISPWN